MTDAPASDDAASTAGHGRSWRRIAAGGGAAAIVLIAAGASFGHWGRTGSGPLAVGFSSTSATALSADGPAVVAFAGGTPVPGQATIDGVQLHGGGGYRAPRVLRVLLTPDGPGQKLVSQPCSGIWRSVLAFELECTAALSGDGPGRAIDIGVEVGPPPASKGCWTVSQVTVRYHVGSRHYVTDVTESLQGCTTA